MNPRNLYSLTPKQQQLYQIQPDDFPGYNWYDQPDEYEHPPHYAEFGIVRMVRIYFYFLLP